MMHNKNTVRNYKTKSSVTDKPKGGPMNKPWSQYQQVIVETYAPKESGRSKIRVRPISGQVFPRTMVVECSKAMRNEHPVGTQFRIHVKETRREGGKPFLYSNHQWPYEIVE